MAWIDDRIWCHPKFTDLSSDAFATYVRGIAYAAGMATRGKLTKQQQQLVGGTTKVRRELIRAELWDENGSEIAIHDWDEHNGKRDERRAADRERKRLARAKEREMSQGTSTGQSAGRSTLPARVEGSEGSEGSDKPSVLPSTSTYTTDGLTDGDDLTWPTEAERADADRDDFGVPLHRVLKDIPA